MAGLNRHQIATHLDRSARETMPYDRSSRSRMPFGEPGARNVELNSREHTHPGCHNRDDRSFNQSLWGRR